MFFKLSFTGPSADIQTFQSQLEEAGVGSVWALGCQADIDGITDLSRNIPAVSFLNCSSSYTCERDSIVIDGFMNDRFGVDFACLQQLSIHFPNSKLVLEVMDRTDLNYAKVEGMAGLIYCPMFAMGRSDFVNYIVRSIDWGGLFKLDYGMLSSTSESLRQPFKIGAQKGFVELKETKQCVFTNRPLYFFLVCLDVSDSKRVLFDVSVAQLTSDSDFKEKTLCYTQPQVEVIAATEHQAITFEQYVTILKQI